MQKYFALMKMMIFLMSRRGIKQIPVSVEQSTSSQCARRPLVPEIAKAKRNYSDGYVSINGYLLKARAGSPLPSGITLLVNGARMSLWVKSVIWALT